MCGIPCQINQLSETSLAQFFFFLISIFFHKKDKRIVMKAKIWNVIDVYLLSNQCVLFVAQT